MRRKQRCRPTPFHSLNAEDDSCYGCGMAWGKSDEEKAAERAAEIAFEQQQRDAADAAAYAASPLGLASSAHNAGAQFFQIALTVSQLSGDASFFGSSASSVTHVAGTSDILGQIEQIGWHLEHAGWTFIETGATSSNMVFGTGQGTVTEGEVTGIYLFRRTSPANARL